jgi:hypothetical protein
MHDSRNSRPRNFKGPLSPTHKTWRAVEKRVKNGVVVEVNELPLPVPKYSFVVSTAKTDDGGQIINTNRHIPLHLTDTAVNLLLEMQEKYASLRALKQEEFDERKAQRGEDDDEDDLEPAVVRKSRHA